MGSGGTFAGLILANKLHSWERNIVGINISDSAKNHKEVVTKLLVNFVKDFNLNIGISGNDINIIDGFVGPGYAIPRRPRPGALRSGRDRRGPAPGESA